MYDHKRILHMQLQYISHIASHDDHVTLALPKNFGCLGGDNVKHLSVNPDHLGHVVPLKMLAILAEKFLKSLWQQAANH